MGRELLLIVDFDFLSFSLRTQLDFSLAERLKQTDSTDER